MAGIPDSSVLFRLTPRKRGDEAVAFGAAVAIAVLLNGLALAGLSIAAHAIPEPELREHSSYVEIELQPAAEEQPDEISQPEFIETNPHVPSNEPDDPDFFAARDQQEAQPEEVERSEEDGPTVDGESPTASKLVEGEMTEIVPPAPPPQPEPANPTEAPLGEQLPAPIKKQPDFVEAEPEQEEGLTSLLGKPGEDDEKQEGEEAETININNDPLSVLTRNVEEEGEQGESRNPTEESVRPRPRPRVNPQVVSGILREEKGDAPIGLTAANAKFSQYGDYLQRMYDAIGVRWISLARSIEAISAERSTRVVVTFSLTQDGQVEDLVVQQSTAGSAATLICKDAIRSQAPFGEWTQEMVDTLNERETVTIRFFYR